MNMPLSGCLALASMVALVLAACGGGEPTPTSRPAATPTAAPRVTPTPQPTPTRAPPQPRHGGTLNTHFSPTDYRNWDSWHAQGGFAVGFTKSLMSNLVQFRPGTFQIVEDLATSWEVTESGKALTFRLRRDAQWHDGNPVTARDVLYSFRRGNEAAFTFNRARVQPVATMETPDDYTFRITLKDVSNSFLPGVASAFMLVYPAHVPDMAQWRRAPFGSGPFVFKTDEPNSLYEFTRNPRYYRKDAAGRALPYLDGIAYHVIGPALALSGFRTGRLDCGCVYSQFWTNANLEILRKDIPNLGEATAVGGVRALQYNLKRAPFSNAVFRQGVGIGLDKESIAATYEGGILNYRPAPSLVPPELGGQWGLPRDEMEKTPGWLADQAQNLAAGRRKFQESGIDPKTVELKLLGGGSYGPLVELYASVIQKDLGLKVSVVPLGSAETLQTLQRGDFDIGIILDSQVIDDPSDRFMNRVVSGAPDNYGGYSNPRLDALLMDQDRELDTARRRQMVQEAQRLIAVEHPITPLFFIKNIRVWHHHVKNYKAGPLHIQNFDFSEVWIDKG